MCGALIVLSGELVKRAVKHLSIQLCRLLSYRGRNDFSVSFSYYLIFFFFDQKSRGHHFQHISGVLLRVAFADGFINIMQESTQSLYEANIQRRSGSDYNHNNIRYQLNNTSREKRLRTSKYPL